MALAILPPPPLGVPQFDRSGQVNPIWQNYWLSMAHLLTVSIAGDGPLLVLDPGSSSLPAGGVVVGTGTSAVGSVSPGTAGDVFTSQGPGVDPAFVAPSFAQASVTLTNAQILALNPTPVTIVPAVAGVLLVPISFVGHFDGIDAADAYSAGVSGRLRYAGSTTDISEISNNLVSSSGPTSVPRIGLAPQALSSFVLSAFNPVGKAIVISGTGLAITGGNAANSLKITVYYTSFTPTP